MSIRYFRRNTRPDTPDGETADGEQRDGPLPIRCHQSHFSTLLADQLWLSLSD